MLVKSTRSSRLSTPHQILLAFVCAVHLAQTRSDKHHASLVELKQFDGKNPPTVIAKFTASG